MSIRGVGGGAHDLPISGADGTVDGQAARAEAGADGTGARASRTLTGTDSWEMHAGDFRASLLAANVGSARGAATEALLQSKPMLQVGSVGAEVRDLQVKINEFREGLGLPGIGTDGQFGSGTKAALIQFQKAHGLDADGVAGQGTWRKLLGIPKTNVPEPKAHTLEAKVLQHKDHILEASEKHGVPPELIAGIIAKESSGRADANSFTGDKGLMQINPKSHPDFFKENDWKDPAANVDYGTKYLAGNIKRLDGDIDKAVASYNAGVGGVRSGLRRGKTLDDITFKPNYVSDILKYARKMSPYF